MASMIGDTTLTSPAPPVAASRAREDVFATLEATFEPGAILEAWADLEAHSPCAIYQTRAWLLPWVATLAPLARITPCYLLARTHDGTPAALLCLGLVRRGPFRLAIFLGGKDSNANLALFRQPAEWSPGEVRRLLSAAAGVLGSQAPDAFVFTNVPLMWQGRETPLARLPHHESPSAAYGTRLLSDAQALFAAKISKESRKKLRKKEARLEAMGPLSHLVVRDEGERARVLDAFQAQKTARFRAQGIASQVDAPQMRAFLDAASPPNGRGIEWHALLVGERIVATYAGGAHAGQWSGMMNSFDADAEIAKSSPGDLLLLRIAADACARGLTHFDLGIGEARYKAMLCDETIALVDCIVPCGLRGALYGLYVRARQDAKRTIKRRPRLLALVRGIRRRLS